MTKIILNSCYDALLPIEVNKASSSPLSSCSDFISSKESQPMSDMISNQNWVSLASPSQILILFLKSALLLARFASQ
jgi:hypothetical protein